MFISHDLDYIIIIIIINGISNAHNHRNVQCSMRYNNVMSQIPR